MEKFPGERFILPDSRYMGPNPWHPVSRNQSSEGSDSRVPDRFASESGLIKFQIVVTTIVIFIGLSYRLFPQNGDSIWGYVADLFCGVDESFSAATMCKLLALSVAEGKIFQTIFSKTPFTWEQQLPVDNFHEVPVYRNYASVSTGAKIIPSYTSPTHALPDLPWHRRLSVAVSSEGYIPEHLGIQSPVVLLEEEPRAGECWRFSGQTGQAGIKLSTPVIVTHVSVNHISSNPFSVEYEFIPKNFSIWTLVDNAVSPNVFSSETRLPIGNLTVERKPSISSFRSYICPQWLCGYRAPIIPQFEFMKLGAFQYNPSLPMKRQLFPIPRFIAFESHTIIFQVESNHGGNTTCLYSIGIHSHR